MSNDSFPTNLDCYLSHKVSACMSHPTVEPGIERHDELQLWRGRSSCYCEAGQYSVVSTLQHVLSFYMQEYCS